MPLVLVLAQTLVITMDRATLESLLRSAEQIKR
jgi:hypothetical protein